MYSTEGIFWCLQFEKTRSPLLRDLMLFLKELMKDYKTEINGNILLHCMFMCARAHIHTHTLPHGVGETEVPRIKGVYYVNIRLSNFSMGGGG